VPESTDGPLAPQAELLLGISLVLRREPQLARSSSFAAATRVWLALAPSRVLPERPPAAVPAAALPDKATPIAEPASPEPSPDRVPAVRDHVPEPEPVPPTRPAESETTQPPAPEPVPRAIAATPVAPSPDVPVTTEAPRHGLESPSPPPPTESPAPLPPEQTQHLRAVTPGAAHTRKRVKPMRRVPAPPAPPLAPELPLEPAELVVETELAGVFYLLNLALYLDLYGDFSRPLEPGLALDPWDLLALLAPRLLDEPSGDDTLWRLLARLAGRGPRVRPGRGFRPPRAWRTPVKWLEPFDHDGTWRWSAARDTLRLVHPAGFPVAAVPRTQAPPRAQLERELRRLRPLAPTLQRATLPVEPAQPLARWTNRVAAYADARLRRALGLGPDDSLDALLLRHHARVFVTPAHVDVTFRLADLPLEIRFAGLDRTPGWIPATGRFVAFHFA
jgi:hypothetical protein